MYGPSVHSEELGQAVRSLHQLRLPVADPGVVDDGIETAKLVDLVGHGFRLRDARQIADDDVLRAGGLPAGLVRARGAAGVQHDLVPLFDQKLGGHLSKAVGGAGDEDARHHESFLFAPHSAVAANKKEIHNMVVTTVEATLPRSVFAHQDGGKRLPSGRIRLS